MTEESLSVERETSREASVAAEAAHHTDHRVRIMAGALRGIEGTIVNHTNESELLVALSCFGRGVYVRIDPRLVEPI